MEPRLPFRLLANSFLLARPAGRNKWLPKAGVTGEREAAVPQAAALEGEVLGAIQAGDALMVKGSLGSRMGPIVKAIIRRYTRAQVHASA